MADDEPPTSVDDTKMDVSADNDIAVCNMHHKHEDMWFGTLGEKIDEPSNQREI